MAGLGSARDRLAVGVAFVLLLVAIVVLALVARSTREAPAPLAGLTPDHVALARSDGLDIRVNAVATEASEAEMERVAVAALGQETFDRLRSEVSVSLARVLDAEGNPVSPGLVWVVHADGVATPPFGGGESAGVPEPGRTFVLLARESLEPLRTLVSQN